ncbi:MAG TPA: methyltransferase domain-containing protein [Anaerolineaceae bacterium]|nr:methyltransferase domain-containing protein [Anaerolineaceae bacterium]
MDYLEENETILEVGIGTGKLIRHMKKCGYSVIGSERSKQMIKINQLKSKDMKMNIVRADNRCLPFRRNGFSKIIATFPSKYIFNDSFYDEAMRCLSKNGEMIILLSVIFSTKKFTNRFYNFLYKLTGMSASKENIEQSVFSTFKNTEYLTIEWKKYKNVELCFLRMKNC